MLSQSTPVILSPSSQTYPYRISCQFYENWKHTLVTLKSTFCEYILFLKNIKRPLARDHGARVRIPLEAIFFPNLYGASLPREFHVHSDVVHGIATNFILRHSIRGI